VKFGMLIIALQIFRSYYSCANKGLTWPPRKSCGVVIQSGILILCID